MSLFLRLLKKTFKKKVKIFFRHHLPEFFSNIYWNIRWRTWDRYYIVKTELKPGYYDKDYLMFCACFSLLVQFIEKEKGGPQKLLEEQLKWEKELKEIKKKLLNPKEDTIWILHEIRIREDKIKEIEELITLWDWWQVYQSWEKKDKFPDLSCRYEIEQKMLQRLVTIRGCLWT
jgi:hypothetical protein